MENEELLHWGGDVVVTTSGVYKAQPNDADVVEVINSALKNYYEDDGLDYESEATAALKALSDNGYRITREG